MKHQTAIKKITNALFADSSSREIHKSVLHSLKTKHLSMAFQPIIHHADNLIFAHESLARPEFNKVAIRPDIWFQIAHQNGHSLETDLLSIRSAVTQSAITSRRDTQQLLFVNVMPSSLISTSFAVELQSMFREGLCDPSQLVLEITEHVAYDPAALAERIQHLRSLGIRFALDDLGLGASNLTSIVELEPDFIKLDRSLVSGIASSRSKQKMVSQLVHYMESGDLIIAEGIENIEDLNAIKEAGVQLSQGYFWGQPQPFSLLMSEKELFNDAPYATGSAVETEQSSKAQHRNGTVQITNQQIIVTNPHELGHFATIEVPSHSNLHITVNGKPVAGRVVVQEDDEISVDAKNIDPVSKIVTRESPDKMEVVLTRQITPGERYLLVEKDESSHIAIQIQSEPLYPDTLSTESIVQMLKSSGYSGDLDYDAIETVCNCRETVEVIVLRGKHPISGTPDSIHEIDRPREYDPLHRRMKTSTVTAGTTVATVVKGTPGIPGSNVFGERIEPPPVQTSPTVGDGITQIGDVFVALRNGRFLLTRDKIDVIPELMIGHNLTSKDGNIDFDGDVLIYGSVLDGAYVQASGTVTVHGSVLCATVMGERGVFVSGSIVGSKIVAGQSKLLYQKTESTLRRCLREYQMFRAEHQTILEHARRNSETSEKTSMIAYLLIEQRHPTLLTIFTELANEFPELVSQDTQFSALVHELRSKWLVIQRTKIHAQDINFLYQLLTEFLSRVQSITSVKPADIRVNTITSSVVRTTGNIIVSGSGAYTSTLESDNAILVKGNVRGGFTIARNLVRVRELGTKSGTETSVRVTNEHGTIAVQLRHYNTLLQVGNHRDRNISVQNNVLYRWTRNQK